MALKRRLSLLCSLMVLLSGAILLNEYRQWSQIEQYNKAIKQTNFADARSYKGEHGLFANAYAEQQRGQYQDALNSYSKLENTENKALQLAVLFNMGNTYMQQASSIDLETDADLALPLIELAKVSYREVLRIDSQHWDAKYNLEQALRLLPDPRDKVLMELEGRRGAVRTVIAADTQENLP